MGAILKKAPCPSCRKKGKDNSGNNLVVYEDNSGYCFACGHYEHGDKKREHIQEEHDNYEKTIGKYEKMSEIIGKSAVKEIKESTGESSKNFRGITTETSKKYWVRYRYDEETGDVKEQLYPVFFEGKLSGFKHRLVPKDFRSTGKTGKDCELFGQKVFDGCNHKVLVIASGELDALSAYQMLAKNCEEKGYDPIPVVSSTIGESGSYKQFQTNYTWISKFEKIVLIPDQDEAGKEAVDKIAKVIPKGRLFIMDLPLKDSNDMLMAGKEAQFINAYFKAKPYTPAGIKTSSNLLQSVIDEAKIPKISLPPFMHELQKKMAGGIQLGTITVLAAASGIGKSSIVEACQLHWIFQSDYKVGVMSLESNEGKFNTKLLSSYVGRKIDLIESIEEKIEFLSTPEMELKALELAYKPDGSPRYHLVEENGCTLEQAKETILELIQSCGVQILIIDPVQDLLEGVKVEEQGEFFGWMKSIVRSYPVSFVLISHTRKKGTGQTAGSQGGDLTEEDMHGSSTLYKSSACNLIFSRNKEAEDEIERNTTYMKMTKCRWTGITGFAGEYYYDNKTATMYDKNDWLMKQDMSF